MKNNGSKLIFYLFAAALLQIVWGLTPSASKFVIDEIPVELYITIRWSLSGAIFALYLSLSGSWQKISLRDVISVGLLGIFGYGLASLGTLYGLKMGGVTNFALIGALGPLITSSVALWILKERPTKFFYFALPISILGLVLLVFGKYQVSSTSVAVLSAGCIFLGYFCEAFVFVYSKKFKTRMSTAQYLALTQITTACLMWALQIGTFHQTPQLAQLSVKGFFALSFVSVVACVLCYFVLYWLLDHIDGHKLALFESLHSVSAAFFGYYFFQESIKPLMIWGGLFILIGLIVGNLPAKSVKDTSLE